LVVASARRDRPAAGVFERRIDKAIIEERLEPPFEHAGGAAVRMTRYDGD
jgi:hypothetical protein